MTKKIVVFLLISMVALSCVFAGGSYQSMDNLDGVADPSKFYYLGDDVVKTHAILMGSSQIMSMGATQETKDPFAACWDFFFKVFILGIGGSLMVLRFATEIVGAIIYEGEDNMGKVRSAIVRFLVHVGIALIGFGAFQLIF